MTRGQEFNKNAKCTHGHRSAMNNSAWCDLTNRHAREGIEIKSNVNQIISNLVC